MTRFSSVATLATSLILLTTACGLPEDGASSSDDGPVNVGLSTVLSGGTAGLGAAVVEGAELAVKLANKEGGIDGRDLKLLVEDNGCNTTDGVGAISKLSDSSPTPVAVLGAFCSNATLASMPVVERSKIPLLVDTAAAASITEGAGVGGNEWVFRWGGNDDAFARIMVDYLIQETDIRDVSIVVDNTDYGQGGLASIKRAIEGSDITVATEDTLDLTTADFTPTLTRIERADPDAVFIWSVAVPGTLSFLTQYGDSNLRSLPLVGRPNNDAATIEVYKDKGITGLSAFHYDAAADTEGNKKFMAVWEEEYGNLDNSAFGYYGYQGMLIAIAAMEEADELTPEGVRDALQNLDYGPSILGGRIKFDDHHQAHNKAAVLNLSGEGAELIALLDTED